MSKSAIIKRTCTLCSVGLHDISHSTVACIIYCGILSPSSQMIDDLFPVCVFHSEPSCWNSYDILRLSSDNLPTQEAQLSPRDRAMRHVTWNLANCHATVQKLLVRQVLNKSKLWRWRVKVGRCVINMCTQPWRVRVVFIVLQMS